MPPFVYPSGAFDQKRLLLPFLGSHWDSYYAGSDVMADLLFALAQLQRQTYLNLVETAQAVSRQRVPVFHTENWYPWTIKQSQLNRGSLGLLKYGDGAVYGPQSDGSLYQYGVPRQLSSYAFPAPASLQMVPLIVDQITTTSLSLFAAVDYQVDPVQGALLFNTDPFTDPRFSPRPVLGASGVTDQELDLWLFKAQFDDRQIYTHWGYVLGIDLPSSAAYRQLINALFDGLVTGCSAQQVRDVLSAVTDVAFAAGTETVQVVAIDANGLVIVTDQSVYRYHAAAQPLVAVGQTVSPGQALCDALQVFELNRGQLPSSLRALSLSPGFLAGGYYADITFQNSPQAPVTVTTEDGFTKVAFPVGGFPTDVTKFWEDTHTRGIAQGRTLAHLLDTRPVADQSGEPAALDLPATVNPLGFLVQNLLRNNAFLVQITASSLGTGGLGLQQARFLRRVVPPHTALLLVAELAVSEPAVIMDEPGTAAAPGYSESVGSFLAEAVGTETQLGPNYVIEVTPTTRQIGTICQ